MMKNNWIKKLFFLFCLSALLYPPSLFATPPNLVHYEGYIVGDNGLAVQDGRYDVTFKIYKVATGGQALWTETWDTSTSQVVVGNGHFRILLGTHNPLTPAFFKENLNTWLGITVGTDSEMLPRQRIASVPYALSAATISSGGGTGIPSGGIIMWSGVIGDIPDGWALCDGTNGTPDLRDRFIAGAGGAYNPAQQGGSSSHSHSIGISSATVSIGSVGNHTHHMDFQIHKEQCIDDCTDGADDGDKHVGSDSHGHRIVGDTWGGGGHTHPVAAHNHSGNISSSSSLPPFFALAFIMKL